MPSTLELCQKYFETKDIYELMDLTKDSVEKDIKKAYYKLSLQVHPDRVSDGEKKTATEKFKVLSKLYSVLTDKDKKALYDEKGIIDDEDDDSKLSNWLEMWRNFFKPITTKDIDNYQKEYTGSELEMADMKKAYLNGKGCKNYMMDSVPFLTVEDEPRVQKIVEEWIAKGEVPEFKLFTEEPTVKRNRRHKKYAAESREAKEIKEKLAKQGESLEQQIMRKQSERTANMTSFFDQLMEKYGDVDDSEEYDAGAGRKRKSSTKSKTSTGRSGKGAERKVKNGKVKKTTRSK